MKARILVLALGMALLLSIACSSANEWITSLDYTNYMSGGQPVSALPGYITCNDTICNILHWDNGNITVVSINKSNGQPVNSTILNNINSSKIPFIVGNGNYMAIVTPNSVYAVTYDYNVLWSKTYNRTFDGNVWAAMDSNGNLYIVGTSGADHLNVTLLKFDVTGNLLWSKKLVSATEGGGSALGYSVLYYDNSNDKLYLGFIDNAADANASVLIINPDNGSIYKGYNYSGGSLNQVNSMSSIYHNGDEIVFAAISESDINFTHIYIINESSGLIKMAKNITFGQIIAPPLIFKDNNQYKIISTTGKNVGGSIVVGTYLATIDVENNITHVYNMTINNKVLFGLPGILDGQYIMFSCDIIHDYNETVIRADLNFNVQNCSSINKTEENIQVLDASANSYQTTIEAMNDSVSTANGDMINKTDLNVISTQICFYEGEPTPTPTATPTPTPTPTQAPSGGGGGGGSSGMADDICEKYPELPFCPKKTPAPTYVHKTWFDLIIDRLLQLVRTLQNGIYRLTHTYT